MADLTITSYTPTSSPLPLLPPPPRKLKLLFRAWTRIKRSNKAHFVLILKPISISRGHLEACGVNWKKVMLQSMKYLHSRCAHDRFRTLWQDIVWSLRYIYTGNVSLLNKQTHQFDHCSLAYCWYLNFPWFAWKAKTTSIGGCLLFRTARRSSMLAVGVLRWYDALMETFTTVKRRSSRQEDIATLLFLRDKDRQKMWLVLMNGDDKPEIKCYHETR